MKSKLVVCIATILSIVIAQSVPARGGAKEDIEAGSFSLDGELPINTDGGLKCFEHPLGASGLRMMYEVYKQLPEKAGPRQVKNPSLSLSHNIGGVPGSGVCSLNIAGN